MKRVWPFVKRLYILSKTLERLRLAENATYPQLKLIAEVERQLEERRPVRVIVLKARQMGFSTAIEGINFECAMTIPNLSSMVISHERDSGEHLLGMTRFYWDTFWAREAWENQYLAGKRLGWTNGSTITVATAANVGSGRSQTLQFLHASEAAFWPDPETLMAGLAQVMPRSPRTFQFIESTANGVGNWFHNTWLEAEAGESAYVPMFFGWWEHPHYHAQAIGLGHLAEKPMTAIDDEERTTWQYLKTQHLDESEIKSRLVWRREMIRTECQGNMQTWDQEYPLTPEHAFIASGANVFALRSLNVCYEPQAPHRGRLERRAGKVEFIPDSDGDWWIYQGPSKRRDYGWYMIGADCSKATIGDFAVAQVINRTTLEQVAVYRSKHIDPVRFGKELIKAGEFYNQAMVAPETNMSGSPVTAIVQDGYPNLFVHRKMNSVRGQIKDAFGWQTNHQTKAEVIGNLVSLVVATAEDPAAGTFRLHDHQTFSEMRNYVTTPSGGYTNGVNEDHDDTVMALAIAVTATLYERHTLAGQSDFAQAKWSASPAEVESQDRMRDAGASFAPEMVDQGDGKWGMSQPGPDDQWLFQSEQPDMYEESDW